MRETSTITNVEVKGDNKLSLSDVRRILPYIGISAVIGTIVGALPGIGNTLAATLGYATGRKIHKGDPAFGEGAIEGIAATEAANSAVAGANLIPVLSLGIPGNISAVFILLATETISGFNPGPAVFRLVPGQINQEMVYAFGLFTTMIFANGLNWTMGGIFMRWMGVMVKIPKQRLLPIVLLLTLTAIYVQQTSMFAVYVTIGFGFLGYFMRKLKLSVLAFVIAFILANNLEESMRQAFAVTGADPWFLFAGPVSISFMVLAIVVVVFFARNQKNLS
jgi:putative tricarboxylic transport membrane protein